MTGLHPEEERNLRAALAAAADGGAMVLSAAVVRGILAELDALRGKASIPPGHVLVVGRVLATAPEREPREWR